MQDTTFEQLLISVVSNDIKTIGYVRRFLADSPTMGRADQAWNLNSLLQMYYIRQE